MKTFDYVITDEVGIHARPAGILVKAVKDMTSEVTITSKNSGKSAAGSKLMAIMGLGIKHGDTVTVTVEGDNEDSDVAAMEEFFKTNL